MVKILTIIILILVNSLAIFSQDQHEFHSDDYGPPISDYPGGVVPGTIGYFTPHPYIYTFTPIFNLNYPIYPLYKIKLSHFFTCSPHFFWITLCIYLNPSLPSKLFFFYRMNCCELQVSGWLYLFSDSFIEVFLGLPWLLKIP